ncbi:MAG: type II toxin-antitoxin system RelE/ParE family toxin [Hyphomicrobiaceae bacterium]|nr:type II toxin-antitoxin system RelE/ParE family toxin [Hyphomicrobiaceae bacterium]
MLDGDRISDSALRRYWEDDDPSGIRPDWRAKVWRILNALDVATSPRELAMPGYKFHRLTGDRRGTFSVLVNRNWRITFKWDDDGPYDVQLEDYHGR